MKRINIQGWRWEDKESLEVGLGGGFHLPAPKVHTFANILDGRTPINIRLYGWMAILRVIKERS